MATAKNADLLGIGRRTGRIAPGYEADVVFLDRDPVTDISNTMSVYAVLNNGEFLPSKTLLE